MLSAIVGINWGDEGKGRMVDLLSQEYDIVVRYQGGNNAGHTVVNPRGKFILNLLPSGILRDETVNVMGPGMVIDVQHLFEEVNRLREAGIAIAPEHLKISDRATICMPYHKLLDCLEEDRLADKKFGSTRRGIAPVYADKYMKKMLGLRIFEDENGKTNLSLADVNGELLMVSQFTLYANCKKGNRPSFIEAGAPEQANELYEYMLKEAAKVVPVVQHGIFGADMKISLENDGPFTVMLDESIM